VSHYETPYWILSNETLNSYQSESPQSIFNLFLFLLDFPVLRRSNPVFNIQDAVIAQEKIMKKEIVKVAEFEKDLAECGSLAIARNCKQDGYIAMHLLQRRGWMRGTNYKAAKLHKGFIVGAGWYHGVRFYPILRVDFNSLQDESRGSV
jgi:hypothetical protein